MRRRKKLGAAAFVVTVAVAAVGFVAISGGIERELTLSAPSHSSEIPHDSAQVALAALAELEETQPEASITEYRRDYFGKGWASIDGCSIRNLVLERDLDNITWLPKSNCIVATGTLDDPYTGQQLQFQHDAVAIPDNPGSQGVQIDHIVSLRAAWFGGANTWSESDRIAFANDTENLIAVDGPANNGKNALGPGEWLVPSNPDHRCDFAAQYVSVADKWSLAVTAEDKSALLRQLEMCV